MTFYERLNEYADRNARWLLVLALAIALAVRFIGLSQPGLNNQEADQALQALSLSRGETIHIGGQPGFIALTSMVFTLFEDSAFLARFWPALFGSLFVLIPWLFKRHLGMFMSLLLTYLFVFEPGLVALSRTADGMIITLTAVLASAGFLLERKMLAAGVAMGVALISSEIFLPVMASMGLTAWIIAKKRISAQEKPIEMTSGISRKAWGVFALAFVIAVALIGSQFAFHPNGLSGIGSSFLGYFKSWREPSAIQLSTFLLIMLSTQFPALFLAMWGAIRGLKEKSTTVRFLGLWWLIHLVLWLLNPHLDPLKIAVINLPAYGLAVIQLGRILQTTDVRSRFLCILETCVTIGLIVFSMINLLNMVNYPPGDAIQLRNRLIGTLLPLLLWIIFTLLLSWGWDHPSTRSGMILGLGLLFAAVLIGSSWKAAGFGSRRENEFLRSSASIVGDSAMLQTMQDIALWNVGIKDRIDVDLVRLDQPSVAWMVRKFEQVSTDPVFPSVSAPSIVISNPDAMTQSQALYRGQMIVWSIEPDFLHMSWRDWILWFFLRETPEQKQTLLLWVRNDLFKGSS